MVSTSLKIGKIDADMSGKTWADLRGKEDSVNLLRLVAIMAASTSSLGGSATFNENDSSSELNVLRIPVITAKSSHDGYLIGDPNLKEIESGGYLYNQLKEKALSDEQVQVFINQFKDGSRKPEIITAAEAQAKTNIESEAELLKAAESAIKTAEEMQTDENLTKAKESLNKLVYSDKSILNKRTEAVGAAIKAAKDKAAEEERQRKVEEELKAAEAKAETERAAEAERAKQAAAESAKAQGNINSSGTKQFSDGRAAFEQITADYGLSASEKQMWEYIITRESGFNPYATNPSSGAYGIPQSLPGNKMASAGADWQTNPYTQLKWMYSYMVNRYGSISGAYGFWQANHWY